jgi:cytidylate kinase
VKSKINIAIDGYSSCGKSTIAKAIARELNYVYIDSGAMYRAITLYALQHGFISTDGKVNEQGLIQALDVVMIHFRYNTDSYRYETFLNGKNVDREIRTLQVSNSVSPISAIKEVRQKLVKMQKRMAESKGVVMDGRDIGSVVFPNAELKLFVTADPEIRVQRRLAEMQAKGIQMNVDEVRQNLAERDHLDSTRAESPLIQVSDALVLDNSQLTKEEQLNWVLDKVALLVTD